jgi:hypothetical protein
VRSDPDAGAANTTSLPAVADGAICLLVSLLATPPYTTSTSPNGRGIVSDVARKSVP